MYRFFIRRPIVAMVIAIITVIVGLVAMAGLPVAQYPNIVPPEILVQATYVGADALTIEQSVATPIEQQMSGVDNMNYMYSLNPNNGSMRHDGELRREDRSEHRPGARPTARVPGGERSCPIGRAQLRGDGPEIALRAAHAYSPSIRPKAPTTPPSWPTTPTSTSSTS